MHLVVPSMEHFFNFFHLCWCNKCLRYLILIRAEQFLQENITLRHLVNEETLFMSSRISAMKLKVNDWVFDVYLCFFYVNELSSTKSLWKLNKKMQFFDIVSTNGFIFQICLLQHTPWIFLVFPQSNLLTDVRIIVCDLRVTTPTLVIYVS